MSYFAGVLMAVGFLGFSLSDFARGRHFSSALGIIATAVIFQALISPHL